MNRLGKFDPAEQQTWLSQPKPPLRSQLHRGRFLVAFVLVTAMMAAAHSLFKLPPDSISAVSLLFLPLVLFGALGAERELLTPSLKELAFYSFAIVAAGLIWPGAYLAVSTYEVLGLMTLAALMAFVFVCAVALGVLSTRLLAGHDGEK